MRFHLTFVADGPRPVASMLGVVGLAGALGGCGDLFDGTVGCVRPAFPAVAVQVTDASGRPAARGATLIVRDGPYADTAFGEYDPLVVGAAGNRSGRYSIELTRPWYATAELIDVRVPGGACGAYETVTVSVTLQLLPGAPPVRNVVVRPQGAGLGLAGLDVHYQGFVDAAPGVDTTVTWAVSDTTVAAISVAGVLVSKCRTRPGEAMVVATSTADTTVKGIGHISVFANAQTCP